MTKEHFYELLASPDKLTKESIYPLLELTRKYPLFEPARMLYLKALQINRAPSFVEELRRHSIYISNLKALFFLLSDRYLGWNSAFEKQLKSYLNKKESLSSKDTISLIDSFLEHTWGDFQAPTHQTISHPEPQPEPEMKRQEEVVVQPQVIEPEIVQEEITIESEAQISYAAYDFVSSLADQSDLESNTEPMKHNDLIDRFISLSSQEPQIKSKVNDEDDRDATSTFKPKKESKVLNSEPSGDDLFTESLAKIYIRQKRYEKALEIIKRLSLKYPKKSVYFADQIRYLELLIANIKKQ
ncbi:MAG: hypothetical protein ACRCZM_02305 [Bacteroidales bacterium]